MHSKEGIESTIREVVEDVTGLTQLKATDSLIDRNPGIIPADFLYIFDILEKKLQLPVHKVFIDYAFEVMTIENLTDAILKL